jgi:hypothetical protein
MRLIDMVAESRTPLDALRVVRNWLEEHGASTAALGLHRESTDSANASEVEFAEVRVAHEEGYRDGRSEALSDNEDRGFEKGWAAAMASIAKTEVNS